MSQEPNRTAKANKEAQFQIFYSELLRSIDESNGSEPNSYDDNNLPTDKEGLLTEVGESYKSIEDYNRREMRHYAHLGLVLAKLKLMYFSKCSSCTIMSPESNMFKILSRNKCIHISN